MIFEAPQKNNRSWEIVFSKGNEDYRNWLQDLWKNFKPYSPNDSKISIENDEGKLNSLTWEMLLANTLLKAGFTLDKITTTDSPDICILIDGQKIWIECCVPDKGNADKPDSVPEKKFDGEAHEVPMDRNTLRFANSLAEKKKQHLRWLKNGVCKENEPFIIALHGLELDFKISNNDMPDIMRALYGMGDMFVTFSPNSDDSKTGYNQTPLINKANNSNVPTTFFCDETNKHITGVIFSRDWFRCYHNSPEYCFVENVFAVNKCSFSFGMFAQEYDYSENAISLKKAS